MTAGVLVAGVVVGGPPDCRRRFWFTDSSRRIGLLDDGEPTFIAEAVPGDSAILVVDAWAAFPMVVLASGDVLTYVALQTRKRWKSGRNVLAGGGAAMKNETLILAGFERGAQGAWRLWGVTGARQVVVTDQTFTPRAIGAPVPGDQRILAVRLAGDVGCEVMLADGSVATWGSRGWVSLNDVFAKTVSGLVTLRALRGFCLGHGRDVAVGEVFEIAAADARKYLSTGKATAVGDDAA